jgi:hypothetical protein
MLAGLTTDFFWYGKWRTHEVAQTDGVLVVEVAKHYRESPGSVTEHDVSRMEPEGIFTQLDRENRELRRSNEILKAALAFFARETRSATAEVVKFIDSHKKSFGVEPICAELPVAPSRTMRRKPAALSPGTAR